MRRPGARWQPQCCASSPPPYAPPVLGRLSQLLLLPGQATSRRVTACGSAVRSACLSPAAIPPHLCRDESRQKCSGQPGYGRLGRWRRQCQSSRLCSPAFASAQNPRCPPQTAPEGRCQASPSTPCCYSTVGSGPFRPRPRRPSAFPHRRSLPLLQGAQGLPSAALQSPPPNTSRHPPGPRSTRFARSAPYVTGRLTAATHKPSHTPGSSETASNIGPQETYAPTTSGKGPSCPARWDRKGINKYNRRQRLTPLWLRMSVIFSNFV